jgi:hypothetical protein
MRRHYVYYRVPQAQLAEAVAVIQALHAGLQQAGVSPELLRRPGAVNGQVTLMDVYTLAELDALAFEARAAAALAPWLDGQRHVEIFDRLD